MVWPAVIAGAASLGSSALSVLGKRGLSEREAMWEQIKAHEYGLRSFPRLQMQGLRRAGVNPMLPFVRGEPTGSIMPSIAAPVDKYKEAAEGVGKAASTAMQVYMMEKQAENIEADTNVKTETARNVRASTENLAADTIRTGAQTDTERQRRSLVEAERELTSAKSDVERQRLQREIIDTAIAKEDLTVAEKDAIVAAIDIDIYESTVGEISRWLERIGVQGKAAAGMAHMLWNMFRQKSRRRQ